MSQVEYIPDILVVMKCRIIKCFLSYSLLTAFTVHGQSVSDIGREIREGRINEARRMLESIEDDLEPESVLFLYGLLSTNADSAIAYYEKLLTAYPSCTYSDDAMFRLAQLKYAQGLYHTARRTFHQVLKDYPRSSLHQRCHYWIGICHQAMGEADSAESYLSKAIDEYPTTDITELAGTDLNALRDESEPDSPEIPSVPGQRWAVQVGAFSHQPNALLRKAFFEQEGYQVDLRTKRKDGVMLYIVWVGSFTTRKLARDFGEGLKRKYGVRYTPVSE